jgi:hypothetical protein
VLSDVRYELQEAESKVVAEEPVFPPAVYLCEYKGLAQIYVLTAQARVAFLRNQTQVCPLSQAAHHPCAFLAPAFSASAVCWRRTAVPYLC